MPRSQWSGGPTNSWGRVARNEWDRYDKLYQEAHDHNEQVPADRARYKKQHAAAITRNGGRKLYDEEALPFQQALLEHAKAQRAEDQEAKRNKREPRLLPAPKAPSEQVWKMVTAIASIVPALTIKDYPRMQRHALDEECQLCKAPMRWYFYTMLPKPPVGAYRFRTCHTCTADAVRRGYHRVS